MTSWFATFFLPPYFLFITSLSIRQFSWFVEAAVTATVGRVELVMVAVIVTVVTAVVTERKENDIKEGRKYKVLVSGNRLALVIHS